MPGDMWSVTRIVMSIDYFRRTILQSYANPKKKKNNVRIIQFDSIVSVYSSEILKFNSDCITIDHEEVLGIHTTDSKKFIYFIQIR